MSDSSGPGTMTWHLAQTDASVSGSLDATDTDSGVTGQGSISGTMDGSTLSFTLTFPAGAFGAPWSSCSATMSGVVNVGTSMIATYSGTNSCTGPVTGGLMELRRQ
jgi:hypothetical protein